MVEKMAIMIAPDHNAGLTEKVVGMAAHIEGEIGSKINMTCCLVTRHTLAGRARVLHTELCRRHLVDARMSKGYSY